MRYSTITFTLAVTASIAHAQQEMNENRFGVFRPAPKSWQPCWVSAQTTADKCYFKSETYHEKTRAEKLEELWGRILPNPELGEEVPRETPWADMPKFFTTRSIQAFFDRSDEKPWTKKNIHTQGLVAQVEWRPVGTPDYTGIYETGSDSVIMRISDVNFLYDGAPGHTPSMALKFLIDGDESQNIFAQDHLLPSDSWNFFKQTIRSRIFRQGDVDENNLTETEEIVIETLIPKMVEATSRPLALAVSHIADKHNNGESIPLSDVKSPYELRYKAPQAVKDKFTDAQPDQPWYQSISNEFDIGDTVYQVYAYTPDYKRGPGESEVHIADIVLKSKLHTSLFGDEQLYFKHRYAHLDQKFYPGALRWLNEDFIIPQDEMSWGMEVPDYWPTDPEEAKEAYISQMETYGCPFAWLVGKY